MISCTGLSPTMVCFSKTVLLSYKAKSMHVSTSLTALQHHNNNVLQLDIIMVQALPLSLATTQGISILITFPPGTQMFQFPGCRFIHLWIQCMIQKVYFYRFSHSVIYGSQNICFSPQLIAACHDLHRLPVPRHPP